LKKLLAAALAGLGAAFAYRKVARSRDEQALWSEATDPIDRPGA
jgi:hypothetical protein